MTFGLRWLPILKQRNLSERQKVDLKDLGHCDNESDDVVSVMILCRMTSKNHYDGDDVFSRLTYKASGQNPVLDYMISVDELPER